MGPAPDEKVTMTLGKLSDWRASAWRGLVLGCCALLLLGQGSPTLSAAPPVVPAEGEGGNEESPPPLQEDDDDDGSENGEVGLAASPALRCHHSQRRSQSLVLRVNRLVPLPHRHCGQAGYA